MSVLPRLRAFFAVTTPAVWVLLALALGAAGLIAGRSRARATGMSHWLFAKGHVPAYAPIFERWNAEQPTPATQVESLLIDGPALERRMLSGFMSGTPVADLVETERSMACRAFTGPLEDVGFVDLTDRLKAEGLMDKINGPSFAPWTSRGRIFGLPHDVHPVMLVYRADLVEAAGIDLSKVETWAEFFATMRPLMADGDGDGRPDRYLLNFWPNNRDLMELLLLQAGGGLFDADEHVAIATERNAFVLANLATWCGGPRRIAVDAPDFTATGNTLRLRGVVVAALMPDWLAGVWKLDMPELAGKLRLMPLPAWEKGGRRTSVVGGTMLGISKASKKIEASWALVKRLYLDPEVHAAFFLRTTIIPPFKSSWTHPVFSAPDPFFGGQPSGQLYISQAGNVPTRPASPYNLPALLRVNEVLIELADRASRENIADPAVLLPKARERLAEAQSRVEKMINRNVFLHPEAPAR
jgi:arabinosaccharide transport system substrate-binding protein